MSWRVVFCYKMGLNIAFMRNRRIEELKNRGTEDLTAQKHLKTSKTLKTLQKHSHMKLTLLSFGIAKDITGKRFSEIELPENCTVAELRSLLAEQYPVLNELSALRFAINSEYAQESDLLQEGDEVALIPPVSGG